MDNSSHNDLFAFANRPVTRRAVFGGAGIFLLAACSSKVAGNKSQTSGSTAGVKKGGNLRVVFDSEPTTLDSPFGTDVSLGRQTANLLYDSLIRMEHGAKLTPMLATSYNVSSDGRTVTFQLRQGVKFHDGTPFNADAVKFNLDRVRNPANNSVFGTQLSSIDSIEVTNASEVALHLTGPSGQLLPALSTDPGLMVSPAAVTKYGKDFGIHPVGTGPFKFVSWNRTQSMKVERNPDYWRKDANGVQLPYLDTVTTSYITDASQAVTSLITGNQDVLERVPPSDISRLQSNSGVQLLDSGRRSMFHIWFRVDKKPLDNQQLRTALAYAINREELAAAISSNTELDPTFIPQSAWWYPDGLTYPAYDPQKAKSMLANAGFSNLSLTFGYNTGNPEAQVAQLVQSYLSKVGVKTTLQPLDRATYVDALGKGNFQLMMSKITEPAVDPSTLFNPYFPLSTGPQKKDYSGESNDTLGNVFVQAAGTSDQAQRAALYKQAQQTLIDEMYYLNLFGLPIPYFAGKKVQNLTGDVDGQWRLAEVWLNQ